MTRISTGYTFQAIQAFSENLANQLLKENRAKLTPEFLASMQAIETELREGDRKELPDRIKSLRGQIALMA